MGAAEEVYAGIGGWDVLEATGVDLEGLGLFGEGEEEVACTEIAL